MQPSVIPKPYPFGVQSNPYPIRAQQNQNNLLLNPSTTPIPEPFETAKPEINPALAAAIYQQHQINLSPTYSPLKDPSLLDPQTVNAILNQQFLSAQNPENFYGFRQNSDGTVSNQNRPPWANWFGTNNNNNNYQSDQQQQQQGPIISFLNNLAQNNPLANLLNGFQQQQNEQQQNPFQSFISNLNPFNLFSTNNNNRPQQTSMQSDYISAMTPQNPYLTTMTPQNSMFSNNLDNSVFSSDQYLNQPNGNFNPGLPNPGFSGNLQSVNFNPGVSNPTPIFNPGLNGLINPAVNNPYLNPISTTHRPNYNQQFANTNNFQPYAQPFPHNPPTYPVFHNPYQNISPLTLASNPNFIPKKKTGNKTSKRKNNKKKVDVPDTDSDWFQDFLDKRKEANLEVSTRRPAKKKNEDDDDEDFDDYFR